MTSSMLRRQLKNLVQNYSEAEVKVREATSNDPWGPSSSQMADISDLTYNVVACNEIMTMLWKRLKDDRNWRHIHKSLTLLEYLLKTGDDRVLLKMKDNIYIVKALTEYRFVEKDGKDQGANVREKAKVVLVLMEDDEKLKEERDFAVKTREKTSKSSATSSTDTSKDPNYRPCYVPGATGLPSLDNIPSVADLTASFTARKEERLRQEAEKKEAERRAKLSEDELKWEDAGKDKNIKGAWGGEKTEEEEVKPDALGGPEEPKEATDPWGTPTSPDTAASSDPWGAPTKTDEDPFAASKNGEDPFAAPKNESNSLSGSKDDPFKAPENKPDPFSAPKDKEDPFVAPKDKPDPFSSSNNDPFDAKDDPFNSPKDDPFNSPKDDPFNSPKDDPFNAPKDDPFNAPKDDPFTAPASTPPKDDPFAVPASSKDDPFNASTTPPKEDPFSAPTKPTQNDPFVAPTTPPKEDPFAVPSCSPKHDASDPFNAPPVTSPQGSAEAWGAPATSPPATGSDPWGNGKSASLPIDNSDPFGDSSKPDNDPWGASAAAPVSTDDAWGSTAPPSDSSPSSDPFGDGASKKGDPWGAPSIAPSNGTGKQTMQEKETHTKTASFLGPVGASLVDLDDLFSSKPKQRPAQTQVGAFKARVPPPETSAPHCIHFSSTLAPSFGATSANLTGETPLFQVLSHPVVASRSGLSMPQVAPLCSGTGALSLRGSLNRGFSMNRPCGGAGMVKSASLVGNPFADPLSVGTGMGQSSFFGGTCQAGAGSPPQAGGQVPFQPQLMSGLDETVNKNSNPFLF